MRTLAFTLMLAAVGLVGGCDVQVDTSDLDPKLHPAKDQPIRRTVAHANCGGTDVFLEYTNTEGEPVARCFGLKEDTQICSLATCETSSDLSEADKKRVRKEKSKRRKKR